MVRSTLVYALVASAGALSLALPSRAAEPEPAAAAQPAKPELIKVGQHLPADLKLIDVDRREITVSSLHEQSPVVIIVYRGGWCPFCTRQMKDWNARLDDLKQAGARIVAVSIEKPERVRKVAQQEAPGYDLLIDDGAKVTKALGLGVLTFDESTRAKYTRYGVKLNEVNTTGAWELPYPATLVVDRAGVVRFIEQSEDFTKRSDPAKVMDVVKSLKP